VNIALIVFVASAASTGYVLFGFPVILGLLARRSNKPIRKQLRPASVTVLIPVRNGARWISAKISSLLNSNYPGDLLDILVVSDGSEDGTEQIVRDYGDGRVRLLSLPPSGKATAVSRGLRETRGDFIVLTDVRQEFDPDAIARLIACFADPSVGLVTGELVIRAGTTSEEYNTGLYWKYEKWIRRKLNQIDAMLGATGSIYAIRPELACAIPPDILLDDVYLPFKVAEQGYRLYFEDEAKAYDFPTSLQSEFWRKVRTQAGVYQILLHFPWLVSPTNRRFIYFVSHKLGRLLLPFFLLAALLSSFWLPRPWNAIALGCQSLFYAIAAADAILPERSAIKSISSPARTFVVLVAAALCAVTVFFRPSNRLWKETRVSLPSSET
jgi:cellulose synthase/poly-beta-1,6-N-acetylglucosamine synthase-like glycosyltransferase